MKPILVFPHPQPFNFFDKWSHSMWKRRGVYLWSIEHRGAYLVSYVGQVFGASVDFDKRIWQEFKRWERGEDYPVDPTAYKAGRRVELAARPPGHNQRELLTLKPIIRLWLMTVDSKAECDQVERWFVSTLARDPVARQFLANRNIDSYQPDPSWPVQVEAPSSFRIVGLNVSGAELTDSSR